MGKSASRSRGVAKNDARVLDAVVAVLDRHGVDGATARRVADEAGLSTGAVYGRFENTDEMLIEAWLQRFRHVVRAGLERSISMAEGSAEAERLEIPESYDPVAERLGAYVIAMSPRNEVLAEVVLPEVDQWFHDLGLGPQMAMHRRSSRAVAIAAYFGAMLTGGIDDALLPDWVHCLGWWESARKVSPHFADALPSNLLPIADHVSNEDELDVLLSATADVVARAGVSGTTITRIARRAGLPRSALYSHFDSRDELVVAAAARSSWGRSFESRRALMELGPMGIARAAHHYLDPASRWVRRRRVEFFLAGISNRSLALGIMEREQSIVDAVLADEEMQSASARESLRSLLAFIGILATGAFVLPETSRVFHGIDWRYGLAPMIEAAFAEIDQLQRTGSDEVDTVAS